MARPKSNPDDPKGHCNLSLRKSIIEALDKEGNRSGAVEWLVEDFLLGRDAQAKRLCREANELKEKFARINKGFEFKIYDTKPKEYEVMTKPGDREKLILKEEKDMIIKKNKDRKNKHNVE